MSTRNNPAITAHYFREKGANAERVIHSLATRSFFTDWCYTNPKKLDGTELCDLLVVFDDTAVIWQIKDLKVDKDGKYKPAEVEKNLRQLIGARRAMFDLKLPIELSNPRRGKELFDPSVITNVQLISVLMGESEEPFSLIQTYKDYQVHVFTREFADIALTELNTIADFNHYLKSKESVFSKGIIIEGGEENLLACYLQQDRSFDWTKDLDIVYIDDTLWQAVTSRPEFIAKKTADRISEGWDSMIERAHEGSAKYERVARELARPDRFTRRVLSQGFLEAYSEFMRGNADMFRRYMPVGDTTYCFLISSDTKHPSPKRRGMLEMMCFVARGIEPFNKRIVGIATSTENRNYDFAYFFIPEWTPENEKVKLEVQEKFGIFKSPKIAHMSADEYPRT